MPGELGPIAELLTKILGYSVDPTGLEQDTRESKLDMLMKGVNAAIDQKDGAACNQLFAAYRELRQKTGP